MAPRDPNSISCKGLRLVRGKVYYLNSNDGAYMMVRIKESSSLDVAFLPPSKYAQATHPDTVWGMQGDDFQASYPLGGYNAHVEFRLVIPPKTHAHLNTLAVLTQRWATIEELIDAIPKSVIQDEGSSKLHTLAFNRTRWRLVQSIQPVPQAGDYHVDLRTNPQDPSQIWRVMLGGTAVYLITSEGAQPAIYNGAHYAYINRLNISQLLSLLQKCIRFRPLLMEYTGVRMRTRVVIRDIVRRLLLGGGGYFLPHLSVFVSARQAVLKRLMIIAAEDSKYDEQFMARCAGFCLLAGTLPQWIPSPDVVEYLCDQAVMLCESDVTSQIMTHKIPAPTIVPGTTTCEKFRAMLPCLVLHHMGGMAGDKKMLAHLCTNPILRNIYKQTAARLPIAPTCLAFDQHVCPRVACLLPESWVRPCNASKPFAESLRLLFAHVTGSNPRRKAPSPGISQNDKRHCVAALRFCERLLLNDGVITPPHSGVVPQQHTLDDGYLCGMIRPFPVRIGKHMYLCTLSKCDPADISRAVVIPKASRSKKNSVLDIDPDIARNAQRLFHDQLCHDGLPIILDPFKGQRLFLRHNIFYVGNRPWHGNANTVIEQIPADCLPPGENLSSVVQKRTTPYPWEDASVPVKPRKFLRAVFLCARAALVGSSGRIPYPEIRRDGAIAGTGMEALTWKFLWHLSEICPGALYPDPQRAFAFRIRSVAKKQQVLTMLDEIVRTSSPTMFPPASRISEIPLYDVQINALQSMKQTGNYMPFLCMPPGAGKTLTILNYLEHMRQKSKSFDVIMWTIPGPSSAQTIYRQVESVGWSPVCLFPSKTIAQKRTSDGMRSRIAIGPACRHKVLIVEHDHLRLLFHKLAPHMYSVAFVCDEVHKAMAKTKRTDACLSLSRMANFAVVLTGTPIISNSCQFLLPWLNMAMPFPVSSSNFWCALNSIVSFLEPGKTSMHHHLFSLDLGARDHQIRQLYPTRQPWYGNNPEGEPSRDDWQEIKRLSNIDASLASQTVHFATQHRDPATGIPMRGFSPSIHHQNAIRQRILELQQLPNMEEQIQKEKLKALRAAHSEAVQECKDFQITHPHASPEQAYAHFTTQFQNVLVVASSWKHAIQLAAMCRQQAPPWMRILLVGSNSSKQVLPAGVDHSTSADLTPARVLDGDAPAYEIVIISISNATGLSLSWCTCIVEGKYETNHANEQQAWGRIRRLDCQRTTRHVLRYVAGYTRITNQYSEEAKQMMNALRLAGKKRARESTN